MFGCSNSASDSTTDLTTDSDSTIASDSTDSPSSTTIENLDPSTLSENGKYFTVEGTTDGIKITLKDDVNIKQDSGTFIQVYDMSKTRLPLVINTSLIL
ncbi:MAG: hypothetical protein SOT46_00015 [Treponema sp.]|nr:hypothetical protein [Treponema sp.]